MNLIIADDHELIASSLETIIHEAHKEIKIFKAFKKQQLFDLLSKQTIDLLIQDLRFGKDNALDFLPNIILKYPKCKIVVLTSVSDSFTINRINQLKLDGFVLKTESAKNISKAIELVISGGQFFSSETNQTTNVFENKIKLSPREKEILSEILKEKSIQQIADSLSISNKTVEMHRANLFIKLDVKNITGLVKKTIIYNLIEDI
ncbi:MAG: response regulator transcription factor [Bacteroidota bacterium]|nr:response regulator transcription factor [Bacteroidota bacterium]MDP3146595.1 response regulator transcription factor [Bacteroidota bacterium]MDP3556249.1 response regulator transcription factor [Bacteroidota bacterium]